jgi:chromosome transmission fidelity protein 1
LFHKASRDALHIDIKNAIVIVDEAHNLIEALNASNSAEVSMRDIQLYLLMLEKYFSRFRTRFNSTNNLFLKKLLYILHKMLEFLEMLENEIDSVVPVNDWLVTCKIDNQNVIQITQFVHDYKLIPKLISLDEEDSREFSITSCFRRINDFLLCVSNFDSDGKIFISSTCSSKKIKYSMLNASKPFLEVARQCRAVILLGGTLQPFDVYRAQLIADSNSFSFHTFSCGHVVSPDNVCAVTFSAGPSGRKFEFTFKNRDDESQILELGRAVINCARIAPGGVIVFFASFSLLDSVAKIWEQHTILDQLRALKDIFLEPRTAKEVENVSLAYSESVKSRGALLFCVINGKMSEGINFNDELARMVIVCGLPYPNYKNNPELAEQLSYISKFKSNENDYYQILCMRAVNQAIGRAIRHREDYAAIVLIDCRFASESITKFIPSWVKERLTVSASFGRGFSTLASFFRSKKQSLQ